MKSTKKKAVDNVDVRLWVKLEGTAVVTMRRDQWERLDASLKETGDVDLDGLPVDVSEVVNQLDRAVVEDADLFDEIPVTHPQRSTR